MFIYNKTFIFFHFLILLLVDCWNRWSYFLTDYSLKETYFPEGISQFMKRIATKILVTEWDWNLGTENDIN